MLFATLTATTAQRKVTTDKLQVMSLKNAETVGFDGKGNAVSKEFPKVDLTPINTELAKKLNAGTYTGTASDLHKNMVKSVENTLPDINGNVKLPPSKAFVGFEDRHINIEYPYSFDEAFIMRQMRIRPIRFISEDGSEQEMSFTFYAPAGIKPIIYDWKTKQSHFDHDTHHPDDKFKIVNYTAPTLDEVLQSGNISKNEVIIGENSLHPMFNKPHVKIKPGEITIASTSPFGGFVKGDAILTSDVLGGATQKFKLGGIGIPEGTLVTKGYVQNSIATKLNAGTYTGTAQDLKTEIDGKLGAETDPKFTAWGKDYNDLINKPQFSSPQFSFYNDELSLITAFGGASAYIPLSEKLDRGGYTGTAQDLDTRLANAVEISVNPPDISNTNTPFVFKMLNQGEYHGNPESGMFFGSTDGSFGILIDNINNSVYFLRLHNGSYEWKRVPFMF